MKKTLKKLWDYRIIVPFLAIICWPWWLTSEEVYLIKDKDIKKENTNTREKDRKDQYLIYTDKTTLKITDNYWYLNFSSSDKWGKIERGQKYLIKTYGIRLGWFSWYPNIVKYEKI